MARPSAPPATTSVSSGNGSATPICSIHAPAPRLPKPRRSPWSSPGGLRAGTLSDAALQAALHCRPRRLAGAARRMGVSKRCGRCRRPCRADRSPAPTAQLYRSPRPRGRPVRVLRSRNPTVRRAVGDCCSRIACGGWSTRNAVRKKRTASSCAASPGDSWSPPRRRRAGWSSSPTDVSIPLTWPGARAWSVEDRHINTGKRRIHRPRLRCSGISVPAAEFRQQPDSADRPADLFLPSRFALGSYQLIVRPTIRAAAQAQMGLVSEQLQARVTRTPADRRGHAAQQPGLGKNGA